jgi:hypothetical protein
VAVFTASRVFIISGETGGLLQSFDGSTSPQSAVSADVVTDICGFPTRSTILSRLEIVSRDEPEMFG